MAGRSEAWALRRAELLRRHGSWDAVLEPCGRELALLSALAAWRIPNPPPHGRWTLRLEGWDPCARTADMPPAFRAAVAGAYPMPATFAAARAELAYWRARNADIEHALSEDGLTGFGDEGLDPVASARMALVREAVECGIRLSSLDDDVARLGILRSSEFRDDDILDAALRDLRAIAAVAASAG